MLQALTQPSLHREHKEDPVEERGILCERELLLIVPSHSFLNAPTVNTPSYA
jgi:hypothetical protein